MQIFEFRPEIKLDSPFIIKNDDLFETKDIEIISYLNRYPPYGMNTCRSALHDFFQFGEEFDLLIPDLYKRIVTYHYDNDKEKIKTCISTILSWCTSGNYYEYLITLSNIFSESKSLFDEKKILRKCEAMVRYLNLDADNGGFKYKAFTRNCITDIVLGYLRAIEVEGDEYMHPLCFSVFNSFDGLLRFVKLSEETFATSTLLKKDKKEMLRSILNSD